MAVNFFNLSFVNRMPLYQWGLKQIQTPWIHFISIINSSLNHVLTKTSEKHKFTDLTKSALREQTELNKKKAADLEGLVKSLLENKENTEEFKKINESIEKIFEDCLEEENSKEMIDKFLNFISLENLINILKKNYPFLEKEGFHEFLKALSKSIPTQENFRVDAPRIDQTYAQSSTKFISGFFPNLFYVFMRAFDLLNSDRPPESLYEYSVLVTLYINFFSILYHLISALSKFVSNPWHVLAIVVMTTVTSISTLYIHFNFLRKCPSKIVHCENLTVKEKKEGPAAIVGFKEEYDSAKRYLKNHLVVLVGKPGVGKSMFLKGLPGQFPKQQVFLFDNASLYKQDVTMLSPADRMANSFKEVIGHENEVIFCYDELNDGLQMDNMRIFILTEIPKRKVNFIAAMTTEQWNEFISKAKGSGSEDRFRPIFLEPATDKQTEMILLNQAKYESIDIYDRLIKKLIKTTNHKKIGDAEQPRKAMDAFNLYVQKIRQFDLDSYKSPELKKKLEDLEFLKSNFSNFNSPIYTKDAQVYLRDIKALKAEIKTLQEKVQQQKEDANKVKRYLKDLSLYKQDQLSLIQLFKQKGELDEESQKRFLFANFFSIPYLLKVSAELEKKLDEGIFLRMNEAFVKSYFGKKSSFETPS
jgi:hypothetical protein